MRDSEIVTDAEHPEADPLHMARMIVRAGHPPLATPKQAVSLRLDADVVNWFRAAGTGWQTRMNSVLKAYKQATQEHQHSLMPLQGSGRGLWGKSATRTIRKLKAEWER
jgi:uncharacterized protein (DUF4415 family)